MHKRDVGITEEREEAKKKAPPIFDHPEGRFYRIEGLELSHPEIAAQAKAFVEKRRPKLAERPRNKMWCEHDRNMARIDGSGNVVCTGCSPLPPGEKSEPVEIW